MDQQNSVDANEFRSILYNFGMKNFANKATHNLEHTLDLVIECDENPVVRCIIVEPQNTLSDHMVVNFKNFVDDISKIRAMINFRNYKSLDVVDFSKILLTNFEQFLFSNCTHLPNISPMCVSSKTKFYRNDASSYTNQKAPLICKKITVKETGGVWYISEIREAKKIMRKAEKIVS